MKDLRYTRRGGISGSGIRDMMLEAVEQRFGSYRTPHPVEMLSDNGSPYIARDIRIFASQLGQATSSPCPARSEATQAS